MDMSVSEYTIRVALVTLYQRIDEVSVPWVRERLDELIYAGVRRFVLDLAGVTFIDNAGLEVLASLLNQARQQHGDVFLVWPEVYAAGRILMQAKFDRVFTMFATADAAMKEI